MSEEGNQERFYKILENVIDKAFKQSWRKISGAKKEKVAASEIYESLRTTQAKQASDSA